MGIKKVFTKTKNGKQINVMQEFEPLEKATVDDPFKFMSAFGDDAYYITDEDIDFIKSGGVLGNLGEYGLLIMYKKDKGV